MRLLTVLLGILATVSIAGTAIYFGQPQYEWLAGGRRFGASEILEIETKFAAKKLSDYSVVDDRIRIPRQNRHEYVTEFQTIERFGRSQPIRDVVEQPNPFESNGQRLARMKMALQSQLAISIRSMEGIEDVTVHIDEATMGTGLRRQVRSSAMVVVQPTRNSRLDLARVESIRNLVAAAKVNLTANDVTVTDLATGVTHVPGDDEPVMKRTDRLALRKLEFESQWADKIRSVLSFVPDVEVSTDVELKLSNSATEGHFEPTRVTASIGIPGSYLHDVWRRQAAYGRPTIGPTTEEIDKLEHQITNRVKRAVAPLLPRSGSGEPPSEVIVSLFPDGSGDGPDSMLPTFSLPRVLAAVCLILAIGCALGAVRGLFRDRDRRENSDRDHALAVVAAEPVTIKMPETANHQELTDDQLSEQQIHDELASIVKEDPQAAAELLKRWVDQAG